MEDRISVAESRGAAPGLLFQSLFNALQQRNSKVSPNSNPANENQSSESEAASTSNPSSAIPETVENLDDGETWRDSLSSTRRKINQTWEQYSPTFKDKVQRYSPNPLRKLKILFTLSEEKDQSCNDGGMETDIKTGNNLNNEEELTAVNSSVDGKKEEVDCLKHGSSQKEKVPSGLTSLEVCGNYSREPGISNDLNEMDHHPPYIVLEEADTNGNDVKPAEIHSDHLHHRKSPLTVQEWVDHLPVKHNNAKDCDNSLGSKDLDNLAATEENRNEEKKSLIAQKISREASVQSSSSLDSLLDARRPDPVEVLLNLGFGGVPGVDMNNCRIPKRFLVPSKCKGGDWNEFFKRELLQAQNFECASLGFRGLSGPSYRRPSAIVANIMEKLRERNSPRHQVRSRFSSVARRIINEKSVLNKLVPPSQSVLSPDSRRFLDNQGKISPEVPRRRIIFGQKSFAFGNDGEFIEVDSHSSTVPEKESPTSADNSSAESDYEDSKMNSGSLPSPEVMLKLRRSSLQRQKKVEEEPEMYELDVQVEKTAGYGNSESKFTQPNDKIPKEDKKIPRRFVSSSNLRQLAGDDRTRTSEEIKLEVEEEMKSLSQKIQNASNVELSSILLQMKELRTRLENSS